jgi:hypothetical protein
MDVIDRLRGTALEGEVSSFILNEAADEIERLRAALRRIDAINDNPVHFVREIDDVCRAALSPSQSETP